MKEDRALVFLSGADRLIEKAETVGEAKDVADTARAVEVWARRTRKGPEVIAKAVRYQGRAERRLGELLTSMKERGEREGSGGDRKSKSQNGILKPQLKDLGVTAKESSRAQLLARMPANAFETSLVMADKKIFLGTIVRAAKAQEKEKKRAEEKAATEKAESAAVAPGKVEALTSEAGEFSCIYADPPWRYGDDGCSGGVSGQYDSMPLEAICSLPVWSISSGKAHLWLWTTWPMIRDGAPHQVLKRWGFRWVGEVVWVKPGLGVGRWLRPSTEILVLGVRGAPPRSLLRNNQRGHLEAPRKGHSRKPDAFYDLIESLSPGPRIELFARRAREGWSRWGKEA